MPDNVRRRYSVDQAAENGPRGFLVLFPLEIRTGAYGETETLVNPSCPVASR